jgi:hypothetical protein
MDGALAIQIPGESNCWPFIGPKTKTSRRTNVAKLLTATRFALQYQVGVLLSAKPLEKGRLVFAKPARVREMENH